MEFNVFNKTGPKIEHMIIMCCITSSQLKTENLFLLIWCDTNWTAGVSESGSKLEALDTGEGYVVNECV